MDLLDGLKGAVSASRAVAKEFTQDLLHESGP